MDQEALTRALAALGHPIRMSLYRRLAASGAAGSGPVALAAGEGIRHNLVSYHLQPLVTAGLVESERRGREVNYRLAPGGMQALTADMMRLSQEEA